MKKDKQLPILLLVTLFSSFLLMSIQSIAQDASKVKWYADPDNSITSNFRRFDTQVSSGQSNCSPLSSTLPTAGTVNDNNYGKVWKIRKNKNRKRAEFARTALSSSTLFIHEEGKTYYYGWRWKISSNDNINNGVTVWQWKTDAKGQNNTQNYPLAMGYANGVLTLSAYGPFYPEWNDATGSINKRKTDIWTKSVAKDKWVSIIIRIKTHRNKSQGFVEVWFNGSKQELKNSNYQDYTVNLSSDKKRAYHKTMDGGEMYAKWGVYNSASCPWDISTFYDEMRVTTTLNEAKSSTWDPGSNNFEGTYYFRNVATGTYLDSDGTNLKVGPNNGAADRRWRLVKSANGYYNIDSEFSGRGVLETQDNKVVRGTTTQPVSTADNREWSVEPEGNDTYLFKSRKSGHHYLAAITSNSKVEWTSWNGDRAKWVLESVSSSRFTATEEIAENFIGLYPNPVGTSFSVGIGNNGPTKFKLYNTSGKLVIEKEITEENTLVERSCKIKPGLYIYHLETLEGVIATDKIIFE